jgi:hypothetical protein
MLAFSGKWNRPFQTDVVLTVSLVYNGKEEKDHDKKVLSREAHEAEKMRRACIRRF